MGGGICTTPNAPRLLKHFRLAPLRFQSAPASYRTVALEKACFRRQARDTNTSIEGYGFVQLHQRKVVVMVYIFLIERMQMNFLHPSLHRVVVSGHVLGSSYAAMLCKGNSQSNMFVFKRQPRKSWQTLGSLVTLSKSM